MNGAAAFDRWLRSSRKRLYPKLRDSAVYLAISPGDLPPDPKFCLELGMAIMLNKPILVAAFNDRPTPPGLLRVAHEVVEGLDPDDPQSADRFREAVALFIAEHTGDGGSDGA